MVKAVSVNKGHLLRKSIKGIVGSFPRAFVECPGKLLIQMELKSIFSSV
jgi:hypothetical protein